MKREDYERQAPQQCSAVGEEHSGDAIIAAAIRVATASKGPDQPADVVGVQLRLPVPGGVNQLASVFLGKAATDKLIAQLIHARNDVWPTP